MDLDWGKVKHYADNVITSWTPSSETTNFEANNMLDGLDSTWWLATSSADQNLVFDAGLGNVLSLDFIAMGAGHNLGTAGATVTIQGSPDASTYVNLIPAFDPPDDLSFVKEINTSLPLNIWVKEPTNPVLNVGAPAAWDDDRLISPSVIKDGSTYKMWYDGYDSTKSKIGYATSTDGITWVKEPTNPVLDIGTAGQWDDVEVGTPWVIKDGSTYKMWFRGWDGSANRIGYATSSDGISWTKEPTNPVLDLGAGGQWDDERVSNPCVIKDGLTYKMWYRGHGGGSREIGYATSSDGISWTKEATNPVLNIGAPASWEDTNIGGPSVLKDGSTYLMWYNGQDGFTERIGYASSTDGITWTKDSSNPVLDVGGGGAWDEFNASGPCVIKDGSTYKMWYDSNPSSPSEIGYAESLPVRALKVLITGASEAITITLAYSGLSVELDYAELYDPHRRKREQTINLTVLGRLAGGSIQFTQREVNLRFDDANTDIYDKVDDLWTTQGLAMFFVSWEPDEHPLEVWPVYIDHETRNSPFTKPGEFRRESLDLKGPYEL